jgi:hypothetical protein
MILLLENCWEQVCELTYSGKLSAHNFDEQNKSRVKNGLDSWPLEMRACECRWSCGGTGKKGRQGWAEEGIVRFNELVMIVKGWRASNKGRIFYEHIRNEKRQELEDGKRKRKRKSCPDRIKATSEWSDDEDDIGDTEAV